MLSSVGILVLSAALLMFYLQAHCERILQREFEGEFLNAVANANGLGFPSVRKALEEPDVPVDYPHLLMRLRCDFLALTWLLKNACNMRWRFSYQERLLRMYFCAVYWVALGVGHGPGFVQRAALLKLTSILEFLANVAGERRPRRVEPDVVVEENGTVFLVYPLSDAAREWLDMNTFKTARRLGDIQFVDARHLCALVEAMLDSDLWVVWSSGFSTPRKIRQETEGS
jgi:hypothetical protein